MGQRGPVPQPTALKVIRGNPGKRPLNAEEPKPEQGAPQIPQAVASRPRALAYWNYLMPVLLAMKVLTVADGIACRELCLALDESDEATERIDAEGAVTVNPRTGMEHMSPWFRIREASKARIYRWSRTLGLSPDSRACLKITNQNAAANDEWDF